MNKKDLGFWLLIVAVALYVYNDSTSIYSQYKAGTAIDYMAAGRAAAAIAGIWLLWKSIS